MTSNDLSSYVLMFFDGFAGLSRLSLTVGLVLGMVNCLRFNAGRASAVIAAGYASPPVEHRGPALFLRGGNPSFWWPLVLICLGFWSGGRPRTTPWVVLIGALVLITVGVALHLLRWAHGKRGDQKVAGSAVAVLLSTAMLVLFGLLLVVRLVVVPDPDTGFTAGLGGEAQNVALSAALLPALLLLLTLTTIALAARRASTAPKRESRWRLSTLSATRRHLIGTVVVVMLFAAPLFNSENNLDLGGLATPEFGKIAYLAVLAAMLADYAYGFRTKPAWRGKRGVERVKTWRHVLYPFVLFGMTGATSILKGDIGPLIPVFVGTVAMIVFVVRAEVDRSPDVHRRRGGARHWAQLRVSLAYARPVLVPLVLIGSVAAAVMIFTPYVTERWQVQQNPWIYNWSQACVDPPPDATPPAVPTGTSACQESLAGKVASERSQIAQSLAAITDGGVWGRGLADTTSGRVPAGSTDFVLAVIWSKLGGLIVILLAGLFAVLAAALTKLRRQVPAPDDKATTPARLFVVGMAATLLGQFVFVLAATVNAVPHSGITAPFLSRGGQSTIALGLGVLLAVASHYQGTHARSEPRKAPDPNRRRSRASPVAPAFATCVALAFGITVWPYMGLDERRPFCLTTQAEVDPARCSTDRIAYERTTVQLSIGGRPQYVRDRTGLTWQPVGEPTLSPRDLAGLIEVGNHGGALDLALTDVIDGSSGTSLSERLRPPSGESRQPGAVELSVDSGIQRATSTAVRSDAAGSGPLAGGMVVLEARSGRVLAAASAPTDTGSATSGVPDAQARDDFAKAHEKYSVRQDNGTLNESSPCADVQPSLDEQRRCWRWGLRAGRPSETSPPTADQLRYVEGDPTVELPRPTENRALGRRYGLGSTFKVVVAATYLREPGTTAADLITAPTVINLGTRVINNAGRGPCAGTVDGKIPLEQALAISCNTAFVELAGRLGWPKIRDTARDLGFSIGSTEPGPAWLAGIRTGVDSTVPDAVDPDRLGNNVLGGGQVEGTPLQMATVMAAVANGGMAVQPTLVTSVTEPGGGGQREIVAESRRVLPTSQAAQLRTALEGTTGPGGTAEGLRAPDGRPLWIKTGTHDLFGDEDTPPGRFVRQIAWVVGFLDTPPGPVAFAVAVETRDERAGAERARWLAGQAIAKITEVRG